MRPKGAQSNLMQITIHVLFTKQMMSMYHESIIVAEEIISSLNNHSDYGHSARTLIFSNQLLLLLNRGFDHFTQTVLNVAFLFLEKQLTGEK